MKKLSGLLLILFLFSSCERANDVPSLQEQLEGTWKIEWYVAEHYDGNLNTVVRDTTNCGNASFMNFTRNHQLLVNFDSITRLLWNYSIADGRTLDIEGRKWAITKLDERELHLSLNERDSSVKQRNLVGYHLKRPY
jgi:hypothetical protein